MISHFIQRERRSLCIHKTLSHKQKTKNTMESIYRVLRNREAFHEQDLSKEQIVDPPLYPIYKKLTLTPFKTHAPPPFNNPPIQIKYGIFDLSCDIETSTRVIVYCGGNMEFVDSAPTFRKVMDLSCALSCPVIHFDYPGRGQSCYQTERQVNQYTSYAESTMRFLKCILPYEVVPTEELMYQAAINVVEMVFEKYPHIESVVIWGRSLGSCAATRIIEHFFFDDDYLHGLHGHKIKGVVLESPLSCPTTLLGGPSAVAGEDAFNNLKRIKRRHNGWWPATLIYHGGRDDDIQIANSHELFYDGLKGQPPHTYIPLPDREHDDITVEDMLPTLLPWFNQVTASSSSIKSTSST